MSAGSICVRSVLIGTPDESVRAVAQRMAKADVGTVVILGDAKQPVGIVTDRDVALRCVAARRDPDSTAAGAIMTAPAACIHESTPIEAALARMADGRIRRLVVVDEKERLVGILALDDVLELLAEEATTIGRLLVRRADARSR
jgi:CBS domain-containing protein